MLRKIETYHWRQKGNASTQRQHCHNKLQLPKILSQDVKCQTGRNSRPENVQAKREHQASAFQQRRIGDDLPDAKDFALMSDDPLWIEFHEWYITKKSLLSLRWCGIPTNWSTGIEHAQRDRNDSAGRRQGGKDLPRRDSLACLCYSHRADLLGNHERLRGNVGKGEVSVRGRQFKARIIGRAA